MSELQASCRRAEVLINRRLDSECSHGESVELDSHLAACAACRREYRSARGMEVLMSQLAVPSSMVARDRFKSQIGTLISKNRTATPPSMKAIPFSSAQKKKTSSFSWKAAIAALVAVALVGAVLVVLQKQSIDSNLAQNYPVRFNDKLSILEALSERTLQAAAQMPGTEQARTHDLLSRDLTGAVLFENNDAVARDEAAISYVRAQALALIPELQEGLLGEEFLPEFRARREAFRSVQPSTSSVSLAEASTAYAVEYLEGKTNSAPTFSAPQSGNSVLAAYSDAAVAMRTVSQPLERAELLNRVAQRVITEFDRVDLSPADSARLHALSAGLSLRGTQDQLRQAAAQSRAEHAERIATLLKADADRLTRLQSFAEKLPRQQQEKVMGTLAVTRAANQKMQETLVAPPAQKKPESTLESSAPSTKPTVPSQAGNTPVAPVLPAQAAPTVNASAPAAQLPAVAAPAATENSGKSNGNSADTGSKKETNQSGKDSAPGQATKESKANKEEKDNKAPGSKKDENAVVVPPGQLKREENTKPNNANAGGKSEAGSRGAPEKADRPEALERPEKPERPDRPERPEGLDKPERPEKVERGDRPEKSGGIERGGPSEKPDRVERPEKPDRPERPERPDVPEKPDKPDKPDNSGGGNNGNGNGNGNNGGGNGNNGGGNGNAGGNNPNKPEKPGKPSKSR